jgi:F-type H+-transporting ATPase subunit a
MNIPGVFPDKTEIFGFRVSETLVTAYAVTILVVIACLIFRFVLFPRFRRTPKGFQNIMEICVSGVSKFSASILGEYGSSVSAYIFTLFVLIIANCSVELLGVRSAMTDLNCTIAMAVISFILIIAYSVRYKGVKFWLKTYASPNPIVTPFNIISAIAVPVSLACRLFGNLFSGLVVMDMIYSGMGYFAIFLPALASMYFILFHMGMQSYVFTMLTTSFMKEKLE